MPFLQQKLGQRIPGGGLGGPEGFQNPFSTGRSPGLPAGQFPSPYDSATPGLMANPSSFQFIQAMMNQPGANFGPGNVPDFGTGFNFGVPQYLPQQLPFKGLPPPGAPVSGGGGGGGTTTTDGSRGTASNQRHGAGSER
jgi:hypothetical protein